MSSAVFRVRHIVPFGYNSNDAVLEERIVYYAPIRRGQSIFTVRDRVVITELHDRIANIRVVNVERRFPNRIFINYVQRFEYFHISYGGRYFITDETFHTLRYSAGRPHLIEIRLSSNLSAEPEVGQPLVVLAEDIAIAAELMRATRNFNHDPIRLFRYIDFSGNNAVILQTRAGVSFRFVGNAGFTAMLRTALSAYENNLRPHEQESGTVTVFESDPNRAVWSEN